MNKQLQYGQCSYHLGPCVDDLCMVQLTPNGKEWHKPQLICKKCLTYLKGFYRNVKKEYNKYEN